MEEKGIVEELTPNNIIQQAKDMVEKSEKETIDCINILDKDIAHYEVVKSNLITDYIDEAERLLEKYELDNIIELDENQRVIDIENIPKVDSININELPSGNSTGVILGLISAIAVVFAWIYTASHFLSIHLDASGIPSSENLNKILLWIGGGNTGGEGNTSMGLVVMGISALIIAYGVFVLKVYFQTEENKIQAKDISEEVKFYCTKKEECKEQMKKISEHLNILIDVMKTASIYLDEQNATLRRIKYIEGDVDFDTLHPLSQSEARRTNILLNGIKNLITTEIASENGTLSSKAEEALEKTIKLHHSYKEKIYN